MSAVRVETSARTQRGLYGHRMANRRSAAPIAHRMHATVAGRGAHRGWSGCSGRPSTPVAASPGLNSFMLPDHPVGRSERRAALHRWMVCSGGMHVSPRMRKITFF